MPRINHHRIYVIAEVGSTHDNSMGLSFEMIRLAKEAAVDAVKFQYWSSAGELARRRGAEKHQDMYEKYKLSARNVEKLADECHMHGLDFLCTTYIPEDVRFMDQYVKYFKISSFEAEDPELLAVHKSMEKPVIVSTGMQKRQPAAANLALEYLGANAHFLHCTSGYPTPTDQLNLKCIKTMAYDGLSDHSLSLITGSIAVTLGASIIEKHIRHSGTDFLNPDFPHSLEVETEFKTYVQAIRETEKALGDGVKRVQTCEAQSLGYKVRRR